MKKIVYVLVLTICTALKVYSQVTPLSPLNNTAIKRFIKNETSVMNWYMLKDSIKIQIGTVQTQIKKQKKRINIITIITLKQSASTWIDTTIVLSKNFKPIYHSSYNQQRDMVLQFGENITGYYLDKKTEIKTQISAVFDKSFFDSNFYPQLIRVLPLKDGYSNIISIFDYNPTSKIGVVNATIENTSTITTDFNSNQKLVWKVEVTDEISNNTSIINYYIEKTTRKILRQEIDFGGSKMVMELVE